MKTPTTSRAHAPAAHLSRIVAAGVLFSAALVCEPHAQTPFRNDFMLLGRTDGSFVNGRTADVTPAELHSTNAFSRSLTGDFDGNGTTDFLCWNDSYLLNQLLLCDTHGLLHANASFNIVNTHLARSDGHVGSFVADFDGDGKADILRWGDDYTYNRLYISTGDGHFSIAVNFNITNTHLARSDGQAGSFVADFNGDGKADILRWSNDYSLNRLYSSTGNGYFSVASAFNITNTHLSRSDGQVGSLVADFNGDGKTDILRWSDDYSLNRLYLSTGNGRFSVPSAFNITNTHLARSDGHVGSLLADFNGDGRIDILRWSDDYSFNRLYLSAGNGDFSTPNTFNITNTHLARSDRHVGSLVGDFNGDGKFDLLRWSSDSRLNRLYTSDGDGRFGNPAAFNIDADSLGGVQGIGSIVARFDGDACADVFRWNEGPDYSVFSSHVLSAMSPGSYDHPFAEQTFLDAHSSVDRYHAQPMIVKFSNGVTFTTKGRWPEGTWRRGGFPEDTYAAYIASPSPGLAADLEKWYRATPDKTESTSTHPLIRLIGETASGYFHMGQRTLLNRDIFERRFSSAIHYLATANAAAGGFPWWRTRPALSQGNILGDSSYQQQPVEIYDTSLALHAMCQGIWLQRHNGQTPDPSLLVASTRAANWLINAPDWKNANYRGFGDLALASAFKVTGNGAYISKAKDLFLTYLLPNLNGYGLWETPAGDSDKVVIAGINYWVRHDSKISYFGITLRGLVELYGSLDEQDSMRRDLRDAIVRAVNHLILFRIQDINGGSRIRLRAVCFDINGRPVQHGDSDTVLDQAVFQSLCMLYYYSAFGGGFSDMERRNIRGLINSLYYSAMSGPAKIDLMPYYFDYLNAADTGRDVFR